MDEEEDKYMNIVFELCTAYERQSYIEGMSKIFPSKITSFTTFISVPTLASVPS